MWLYCYQICQKPLNFTYAFKCYQNNVTSKNVSWPHFSWATLYMEMSQNTASDTCEMDVDMLSSPDISAHRLSVINVINQIHVLNTDVRFAQNILSIGNSDVIVKHVTHEPCTTTTQCHP